MKVKSFLIALLLFMVTLVTGVNAQRQIALSGARSWRYIMVNQDFLAGVQADGRTPYGWKSAQLAGKDGVYCQPIGEPCQFRFYNHSKLPAWIYQTIDRDIPAGSTLTYNMMVSSRGLRDTSHFFIAGWQGGHLIFVKHKKFPTKPLDGKDYLISIPVPENVNHLNIVIANGISDPKSKLFIDYAILIAIDPAS